MKEVSLLVVSRIKEEKKQRFFSRDQTIERAIVILQELGIKKPDGGEEYFDYQITLGEIMSVFDKERKEVARESLEPPKRPPPSNPYWNK